MIPLLVMERRLRWGNLLREPDRFCFASSQTNLALDDGTALCDRVRHMLGKRHECHGNLWQRAAELRCASRSISAPQLRCCFWQLSCKVDKIEGSFNRIGALIGLQNHALQVVTDDIQEQLRLPQWFLCGRAMTHN